MRLYLIIIIICIPFSSWAVNKKKPDKSTVVLKPQVVTQEIPNTKYEVAFKYLEPYLESVIIMEDPALSTNKNQNKPKLLRKKPYVKQGKLVIESDFEPKTFATNVKRLFKTKKPLAKTTKQQQRYVVGLKNKANRYAGSKDLVFVSGIEQENNWRYMFVEPKEPLYHPVSKEYLGTIMLVVATGKVIERDELSVIELENTRRPIKVGTLVIPGKSFNLPEIIPATTKDKMPGFVLSLISGARRIATYSAAVVSVGARDGALVGQLLQIKNQDRILPDPYQKNKTYHLPAPEPKGEIMLYEVLDKVSLGIILTSSMGIKVADVIE